MFVDIEWCRGATWSMEVVVVVAVEVVRRRSTGLCTEDGAG